MESFGIVFAEAALYGVPSIGTTAGAVPETVLDGETGLLVALANAGEMSKALRRLRDDAGLRHRLGAAAQVRALSKFSDFAMADQFEPLLSERR